MSTIPVPHSTAATSTIITQELPSFRDIVQSLIASLTTTTTTNDQPSIANPLISPSTHSTLTNALLTLHVLFPNDLLPALDLLDRGLVTRLTVAAPSSPPPSSHHPTSPSSRSPSQARIWLVQSAQQPRNHPRGIAPSTASGPTGSLHDAAVPRYEVRLPAWSCSCPAFAFAAFPAAGAATATAAGSAGDASTAAGIATTAVRADATGWFGGLTRGGSGADEGDVPVCKHLLACALVEHSGVFARMGREKVVTLEEFAGWAAGWGD